jgi:hypothetical protein
MIVVPKSASLAALTELIAATHLLDGVIVKLFSNSAILGPDMVLADLTESAFAGYAPSAAVVWGLPFVDSADQATVAGDSKQFASTAPFTGPETVHGWYLTNAGGTVLICAELLDNPVIFTAALQAVIILPTFGATSQV